MVYNYKKACIRATLLCVSFCIITFNVSNAEGKPRVQAIQAPTAKKVKRAEARLFLGIINPDKQLRECAQYLQNCLEKSSQCIVNVSECADITKKQDIINLFKQGYTIALFVNNGPSEHVLEWRIYDAIEATMIKGRRVIKQRATVRDWAYALADDVWPLLTQQQSSFSTKIAYVKRMPGQWGKNSSMLCICDNDGSYEQILSKIPGIYVGLYWHNDTAQPRLFCSEFTKTNVRLIAVTLDQKKGVILDTPGTCVGISLSPDRTSAVYCKSGDIWYYQFNEHTKKSVHTCIIKNDGKNSSPTLLANGDIVFCSDAYSLRKAHTQARGPQVCYYHKNTGVTELITRDGYCVGPAYTPVTDRIIYSKRHANTMQLFLYSRVTGKHTQLTFDKGNKVDCSWSPCGNYSVFCLQDSNTSRIACIQVDTRERFFITDKASICTCPAWSPRYDIVPLVI